jgi:hypothetical protein
MIDKIQQNLQQAEINNAIEKCHSEGPASTL